MSKRKEVTPSNELEEQEYTAEEFERMLKLYDETMKHIEEGEIVKGKVLAIEEGGVVVDVGFKSEGTIPIFEFGDSPDIKVGDEVEVFLEDKENQDGQVVLSKEKADFMKVWEKIKAAHDQEQIVEGKLLRRIKGGIVVDLFGVDAFLPGSQIDIKRVTDFDQYVGQTLPFKIIKLNKSRRNIVVSRRVVLEEEKERQRQKILAELEKGEVREGVVKNITDFGAFIDLGGIDGLLHITDMSWGRISHPSELLAPRDKLKVKVLDFNENKERISLGLKQLTPCPWDDVEEKYPVGEKVQGKVVSMTDYGAFVELEEGVEGLIHISEMSWTQHIKHPSRVLAVGDVVEVVVLNVDKEGRKISLGLKQVEPDPWLTLDQRCPVGSKIVGKVRNLTNFGAFMEVEEGIDGLVHISDMSWTRRVSHPGEIVKKGDNVEVVVLKIDKQNRRISLGYKQAQEDPWDKELPAKYAVGTETKGKILRFLERGLVVLLPGNVEGFVPLSQLWPANIENPEETFLPGEEIPLEATVFDRKNRRIVLSMKAYFRDKEQSELEGFLKGLFDKAEVSEAEQADQEAKQTAAPDAESTSEGKQTQTGVEGEGLPGPEAS